MDKYEDIFKDADVCNNSADSGNFISGSLERELCLKVNDARKELMEVYNSTRHSTGDNTELIIVLRKLENIVYHNTIKS